MTGIMYPEYSQPYGPPININWFNFGNSNCITPKELELKTVEKQWGEEKWLVNNSAEDYCAKFLNINAGHQFSYHFHKEKHETFILLDGECVLHWIDVEVGEEKSMPMEQLKPVEIPRLMPHSAEAITDCVVLEISKFHKDDDSYRVYRK